MRMTTKTRKFSVFSQILQKGQSPNFLLKLQTIFDFDAWKKNVICAKGQSAEVVVNNTLDSKKWL